MAADSTTALDAIRRRAERLAQETVGTEFSYAAGRIAVTDIPALLAAVAARDKRIAELEAANRELDRRLAVQHYQRTGKGE